jgi:hypothetical protein
VPERETLERDGHPVLAGLLALVGVGLAVGLIAGLAALVGSRMLGLDGDAATAEATGGGQSMYLPKPAKTQPESGPLVTLEPGPTKSPDRKKTKPSDKESTEKEEEAISLSASQTEVAPMEQIDLTVVYPGGEGAILRVENFSGGSWQHFAQITANVSDETFATYIQTGQVGVQRFRMVDTDTGLVSNEVRVRVG